MFEYRFWVWAKGDDSLLVLASLQLSLMSLGLYGRWEITCKRVHTCTHIHMAGFPRSTSTEV